MKVAILSESEVDDAALEILIQGILGPDVEFSPPVRSRTFGIGRLLSLAGTTLKAAHYQRIADAIVVAADSDDSPVHVQSHQEEADEECRYCQICAKLNDVAKYLSEMPGHPEIKTAVAVAVPSMEAWYLCARGDRAMTEAEWIRKRQEGTRAPNYIRKLKKSVYGDERSPTTMMLPHARECAEILAQDIKKLENAFPHTVRPFVAAVKSWKIA